jgi:hypothetical protein
MVDVAAAQGSTISAPLGHNSGVEWAGGACATPMAEGPTQHAPHSDVVADGLTG